MTSKFGRRGANLLVAGGLAGAVAWFGVLFGLLSWVAFIAWVACAVSGGTKRGAATAFCALLAGALSGCLVDWAAHALTQSLGPFSLPLVLSAAVGLISLIEEVPALGQVPIYFLGMIAFFASGLPPGVTTMTSVAIPAVIGTACGLMCPVTRDWLERRAAFTMRKCGSLNN